MSLKIVYWFILYWHCSNPSSHKIVYWFILYWHCSDPSSHKIVYWFILYWHCSDPPSLKIVYCFILYWHCSDPPSLKVVYWFILDSHAQAKSKVSGQNILWHYCSLLWAITHLQHAKNSGYERRTELLLVCRTSWHIFLGHYHIFTLFIKTQLVLPTKSVVPVLQTNRFIIYQRTIGPVPLTWVLRICENQRLLRKEVNIESEWFGPRSMNDLDLWYP